MTSSLSSHDRLVAALTRQSVDHLPFSPFLAYVWESFPVHVQQAGQLAFHKRIGATPLWRGAPCPVRAIPPKAMEVTSHAAGRDVCVEMHTPVGTLREIRRRSPEGNTDFLIEHPLKTAEDYEIQLWIEEHTSFEVDLTPVREHLAGDGREGLSIGMLIPRGKSAYQTLVEHDAGTEELVYALQDYPQTVEALWEAMVANDVQAAQLSMETGFYTYYLTWEDSSTQNYSPRQYRRYIGTEIEKWCTLLAANDMHYIQHACGHLRHILPEIKATGAFGVESISPPPTGNITIGEARDLVGSDFAIIGGIEPTRFLALSPDALEPYVEHVIEEGRGGPFILANSDSCPPGVTEEKFALVADIARRYR
ncbi:MAG: uroporphyrinogen decarboxylase family protein [Anaerolineae bacterium]